MHAIGCHDVKYGFLERFPANIQIGWNPPSILVDVILDRHSRLKTSDLQAHLKALDLPGGTFTPEQVVEFVDLMQVYEGAMYEISTKLEILDDEFQVRFSHDPIHHMERRLKSVSSIIGKLERKGLPIGVNSIKDNLFDVAGIRVICNYRDDVYSVSNYLSSQSDIQVLRVKDYIKNPKQNGYRSLHVIYAVPVFLSSGAHYIHAGGGAVPYHRHGLLGVAGACAALQDRFAGQQAQRAFPDAARLRPFAAEHRSANAEHPPRHQRRAASGRSA